MRTPIKKAIAAFGTATAVGLAIGFGAAGVSPTASASTATARPSSSMAMTRPDAAAPGVHIATLAGCIVGANC